MVPKRGLIVGAGGMGRAWAENLRDHPFTEIAAICDIDSERARQRAEEYNLLIPTGSDLPRLIDEVKPDFVVDVTIPEAHRDVVITALKAGVPVLGEKPMADTLENARAMVQASQETGQLYMVSQSRRYDARLVAFQSAIQTIGSLALLNVDFYLGPHFGGFREEMPSPLLLDMAIHTFDAARKLTGQNAVRCTSFEWNPDWSWYQGAAFAECRFEMTGGVVFHYRGSWAAHGHHTSWEGSWRAVGRDGSAVWDGHGSPSAEVVVGDEGFFRPSEVREFAPAEEFAGGIRGALEEFLHALATGATPQGDCRDNLQSLEMVFMALNRD